MYNHNFIYSKIQFYCKIIIFVYLFIYLSNTDVKNCGEVKGVSKIQFYCKIIIFVYLFIYLSNADVENCGEVKGFDFIYIYID